MSDLQKEDSNRSSESCFSCFNWQHSFRNCPQPRKWTKDGCGSTHNTLLHGAEKIFPRKSESVKASNGEATTCSVTTATQMWKWFLVRTFSTLSAHWSISNTTADIPQLPSVYRLAGFWVEPFRQPRVCFRHASKLLPKKSTNIHFPTDSEAGMT